MKLPRMAGAITSVVQVATALAALFAFGASAAQAQLRMSITFSPALSDSMAPLAVSLPNTAAASCRLDPDASVAE